MTTPPTPFEERIRRLERNQHSQFIGVVCCIVLIAVVGGLLGAKINGNTNHAVHASREALVANRKAHLAEAALRRSELRTCHRLNILRASENRSHHQDYIADVTQYNFDQLFASLVIAGLHKQTGSTPRTHEQETQTRLFVRRLRGTAASLLRTANGKEWIALTNCHSAVFDRSFQPPIAHTFHEHRHDTVVVDGHGRTLIIRADPSSGSPPESVYRVGRGE